MAKIDKDKKLLSPILDRLLYGDRYGSSPQPHQVLRQLRESVRRDLEHLFNTRYRCIGAPPACEHLQTSLINFGLPDLSTVNLTAPQSRDEFCRQVEQTITNYEPRIKSVKVIGVTDADPEDPVIRFRIEALLHANPAPEVIVFDSALNPVNHTIDVSEIA
ncbi:type VI secretion system baseplate subunit TssE [Exilibacterium tricleocarpae]|uniref:Type VI secretion system baseplate subunit TssE n=1 Tax=Exilibacterium tricleocarpae TaxID=2591008 RepID=A0A545SPN4_9GAMM|nr:type VI secretion system baseplate subunit TssE [Exilibacterium tricleocarpae]TQV66914.1 type VI secretion system baseplate subunit TssE [Exilibacterium tricleocarpae]